MPRPTPPSPCGPAGCIVSNDDPETPPRPSATDQSSCSTANCIIESDNPYPNARPASSQGRGMDDNSPQNSSTRRIDNPRRVETPDTRRLPYDSPPEPLTDFEKFVQDTTGGIVPLFGRKLFLNTPADFLPATSVSPPADYIIGSGDQMKIHTWGNVNMDVTATVDRNGQLFIPQVGTLSVTGMRADQLEGALRSSIGRQFRTFDLSVTLGQLRSIQVFVLGQARQPGVYTVSSLSTLVNALFTSGGPSASGSMRDIQVKRSGVVLTHFDVYDLLLNGDKSKDVHLLPGDIIYIPVTGPQIAIVGDVTTPAIYELKGQTMAEEALQLAGGLTPVAGVDRAALDRIVDHSRRTVEEFSLNGSQRLIPVQGGDVLRVFPISPKIQQAVTLRGYVGSPGRYAWHPGKRISDLIPSRQFLLTRNFYNQQNALSPSASDRPFAPAVNEPQRSTRTQALTNAQAAAAASNPVVAQPAPQQDLASHETEINWNYASVERLGTTDLTTHIISFSLGEAIDHPESAENKLLEPGDVVIVYSVKDINLPSELRARFVRIDGEVVKPGIYRVEQGETLRELVARAGGLASQAYPYASLLTRESVRLAEESKLQSLLQREAQEVLSPINYPTSADGRSSTNDLELRRSYLEALRQIHATGRVVLQVSPKVGRTEDLPQFSLQDGDHFFVPAVPNTVDVLGNVFNQGALQYTATLRVGDYLKAAGGHTREADKARDFVLRADGTVLSRGSSTHFEKLLLYPGDSVVVPARFRAGFNLTQALSVAQLTSSLAISAATLSLLR